MRLDVACDPVKVAHGLGRAGDDQEALPHGIGLLADHGHVTLKAAALIEQGGIDHAVHRHVHVLGAQALQHRQHIAAGQQELGKRALVIQRHGLAGGALLGLHSVQPARPAQCMVGADGVGAGLEVVHPLPTVLAAKLGALRCQQVVKRRGAQRPHCFQFLARPAHGVVQAQGLGGAFCQRPPVAGEWAKATNIHIPQVGAGLTAHNPLGHQPAGAARVGDAR